MTVSLMGNSQLMKIHGLVMCWNVLVITVLPAVENIRLSGEIKALGNDVEDVIETHRIHDHPIDEVQITPNGDHVIYLADDDYDGVRELYTVPVGGGVLPKKLYQTLAPPADTTADVIHFEISSDSRFVVFNHREAKNDKAELWVAPADGSSAARRLRPEDEFPEPGVAIFQITPDGGTVVFSGYSEEHGDWRLYSVPVDDEASSPIPISSGPVWDGSFPLEDWQISPDSNWVAYVTGDRHVYSAEVGEAESSIPLDIAPANHGLVYDLSISSDSMNVFFWGRRFKTDTYDLIGVPIDGSKSAYIIQGLEDRSTRIFHGGDRIAYMTFNPGDSWRQFLTPIEAGASRTFFYPSSVQQMEFTPDGTRLIYVTPHITGQELRSISSSGGDLIVLATALGQIDSFKIHKDSQWVTFVADLDTQGVNELYTVSASGGVPVKIHGPRVSDHADFSINDFKVSADGSYVAFLGEGDPGDGIRLFGAPAHPPGGVGIETELSGSPTVGGNVTSHQDHFEISPDGSHVVFAADLEKDDVVELFSVDTVGGDPVRLSRGYAPVGDVAQVWSSPDKQWTVYRADQDVDGRFDLYAVPTQRDVIPVRINEIENRTSIVSTGEDVVFSANSEQVFFLGASDESSYAKLFVYDLIDGLLEQLSQAQDELPDRSFVRSFRLHPDGLSVIYLADHRVSSGPELYQVRIDLSEPPVRLGPDIPSFAEISEDYEITPDGSAVVFSGDFVTDGKFELFKVDLDSQILTDLSQMIQAGSDVLEGEFQFAMDEESVVFRANRDDLSLRELFVVPLTAASAPVKVGSDHVQRDFSVTGGEGNELFFRAGSNFLGPFDLFHVDLTSPGQLSLHSDVDDFRVSADGSQVVFRAEDDFETHLFLRDVLSPTPAEKISPEFLHSRAKVAEDYGFSPDGQWAVFRTDSRERDLPDLFKVSTAGGGPAVMVTPEDTIGTGVASFDITPESYRVTYRADINGSDRIGLFSVPLDGSEAPTRLDTGSGMFTDVSDRISFLTDGSKVLFTDDRRKDETLELYAAFELPTITPISDYFVLANGVLGPLPFSVYDLETRPTEITVTAKSSDQILIPNANLVITGSGAERQITVTPEPDLVGGPVTITITVEAKGETVVETFTVTVVNDTEDEYRQWLERFFEIADLDDPEKQATLWGAGADPDRDGLSNFSEWGKGLNPSVADIGEDIFEARIDGEVLTLRYRRAEPSPATLLTSFEWSPDLSVGSWVDFLPDGPTVIISDLGDAQIIESSFPLSAPVRTRMFVREVYRDGL